jgi:hypothetical protein
MTLVMGLQAIQARVAQGIVQTIIIYSAN